MGYMKIPNLYKDQTVLMFKEVYVMEKIHGTSAHIRYQTIDTQPFLEMPEPPRPDRYQDKLTFFSGGEKHENFVKLWTDDEQAELTKNMKALGIDVTIYGEAYGGKCQGMSDVYGKQLRFVAFEVQIGNCWLSVPDAAQVCQDLGIEFVWYTKCPSDLFFLDTLRDIESQQAIRNALADGTLNDDVTIEGDTEQNEVWSTNQNFESEGIIIRPLIELTGNNGKRIIAKHKREKFRETAKVRQVSPEQLQVLSDAKEVADEWCTEMRLVHVVDKLKIDGADLEIKDTGRVIKAMIEDVRVEGEGEIEWSKEVSKAIGKRAGEMFKAKLRG